MRNIVLYILRQDLRTGDNPILSHLATTKDHGFTHLLPAYIFPANQVELSGFIKSGSKSPYPEARSRIGSYWRCGPHRAKFVGEAVWNVKESLQSIGSNLVIRLGTMEDAVRTLLEGLNRGKDQKVGAVWMTSHDGTEERNDERAVAALCKEHGAEFKLWDDEKYFIDDRDLKTEVSSLPDIFTTYRKSEEPLRDKPRATLPTPPSGSLPPFPDAELVPSQAAPFSVPDTLDDLVDCLVRPVKNFLTDIAPFPKTAVSAHPFKGGESAGQARLHSFILSGGIKNYAASRNGLVGTEFSTKLSAYLAQGCITSRQIHHSLLAYEDGTDKIFESADGFGAGENEGTKATRFELLWRDYMRLCHRKFKHRLFRLEGFKGDEGYADEAKKPKWKTAAKDRASANQTPKPEDIAKILDRFNAGITGMGLIDASQRELLHTGYTSNRARQNVASFLSKHLEIDWRYGAEWYEMLLIDYDVASNWGNWQYVAGVGNDPRSEIRIFNPVRQAIDYDKGGFYIRSWVPEVGKLKELVNVAQAWTAPQEELVATGLKDNVMVTDPVKRIIYLADGKPPKPGKRPFFRRRGTVNRSGDTNKGEAPTTDKAPASDKRASVGKPISQMRLAATGGFSLLVPPTGPTYTSSSPPQGPSRGRNNAPGRGGAGRTPRGGRGGFGVYQQGQQAPSLTPRGGYQGSRGGTSRGRYLQAARGGRGGARPQQIDG